jgi:hypothetical protein
MSDQLELAVSPDKVCFLIARAREFHAKEDVVIPEEPMGSAEDWARQVLADHRDDPSYQELHELIDAMDVEEQVNLVALMWLGRGDFSTAEWSEALQEAGERLSAHTADYIIATLSRGRVVRARLHLRGHHRVTARGGSDRRAVTA